MGFDIVWGINIDISESIVINFSAQNNFPAPLADLDMFHINVERWVKQDKSTATMFCAVTKHYFTAPFSRPYFSISRELYTSWRKMICNFRPCSHLKTCLLLRSLFKPLTFKVTQDKLIAMNKAKAQEKKPRIHTSFQICADRRTVFRDSVESKRGTRRAFTPSISINK